MQYRNIKNGRVIDVSSILISDVWEAVEEPSPVTTKEKKVVKDGKQPSKRK
nr:MAG TPA: hypothetical protein [Caudoviricetes sp.]DAS38978.1 MAG TPA: hypothetical protein [Caudoviricetes sp.]DAS87929.1 MAG TPA: hypothetical protein [Caudoviricetes sp.]DAX89127.1 MAG TPA: hypothetical protein [Caudoviricetes sp.]